MLSLKQDVVAFLDDHADAHGMDECKKFGAAKLQRELLSQGKVLRNRHYKHRNRFVPARSGEHSRTQVGDLCAFSLFLMIFTCYS